MAEFEPTDDRREDPASDAQVPFDGIVEGSQAATGGEPDADAGEDGPTLVRRPVYRVQIEAFEGPLDLLLHLIREHEIDIYDIPIA